MDDIQTIPVREHSEHLERAVDYFPSTFDQRYDYKGSHCVYKIESILIV